MKVVMLNAGSGSQKCSLFELPVGRLSEEATRSDLGGEARSIAPDQPNGKLVIRACRHGEDIEAGCLDEVATTAERTERLWRLLWEEPAMMVSHAKEVDRPSRGAWWRRDSRSGARDRRCGSHDRSCVHFAPLQAVIKEAVGIHVLLTRSLFGDGILHRLLRPVSLAKPTSAPLRF